MRMCKSYNDDTVIKHFLPQGIQQQFDQVGKGHIVVSFLASNCMIRVFVTS